MPIFRNELVQSAARKNRLNKARLTRAETNGLSRRVRRIKTVEWKTHATFIEIDGLHNGAISAAVKELSIKHPDRKLNTLDFGCGDGTAAKQVAKNNKLNVFGFSIDSSEAWLKPEGVTFLQTAVDVLPTFLRKNKINLDIVYERASLKYLPPSKQVSVLEKLSSVLNVGGRVFVDSIYAEPRYVSALQRSGYSVEVNKIFIVSLTKVR